MISKQWGVDIGEKSWHFYRGLRIECWKCGHWFSNVKPKCPHCREKNDDWERPNFWSRTFKKIYA